MEVILERKGSKEGRSNICLHEWPRIRALRQNSFLSYSGHLEPNMKIESMETDAPTVLAAHSSRGYEVRERSY